MIGDVLINAYADKDQQILGNLDGQALLRGFKDYTRANAYKRVKVLPKEQLSLNGRVVRYRITRVDRSATGSGEVEVNVEEILK